MSITGISNLTTPNSLGDLGITGFAGVFDQDAIFDPGTTASANGSASINGDPFAMAVGDSIDLVAMTMGQGGSGSALGFAFTDGAIELDNFSSTDTFLIDFELSYMLAAMTGVNLPAQESAFASAFLYVFATFDEIAFVNLEILPPSLGDSLSESATVNFQLSLAPGDFDSVSLFADAEGSLTSVPEPGSMLLFGAGLAGLSYIRRRQAKA